MEQRHFPSSRVQEEPLFIQVDEPELDISDRGIDERASVLHLWVVPLHSEVPHDPEMQSFTVSPLSLEPSLSPGQENLQLQIGDSLADAHPRSESEGKEGKRLL